MLDKIKNHLKQYIDPFLKQDIFTAKVVKSISFTDNRLFIEISLGFPAEKYQHTLIQNLTELVNQLPEVKQFDCKITWSIDTHKTQSGTQVIAGVKNIIAVASGKGGVGKSTTAVNLALALKAQGAIVGLLDADIYGPSVPTMLACEDRPEANEDKKMTPLEKYGIQFNSIGLLVEKTAAMVWRGPMVTGALKTLLNDTCWDNLDYLIIDLPPGTGDIQLTMAQKIPVAGAVIVTTPQDLALMDARRAINMFNKVNVPTLGIIENMSTHICSACGHIENIFGQGGGDNLAEEFSVPLLGQLPLALSIREQTDSGKPTVVAEPESEHSKAYLSLACKMAAQLASKGKDFRRKFPKIVVE